MAAQFPTDFGPDLDYEQYLDFSGGQGTGTGGYGTGGYGEPGSEDERPPSMAITGDLPNQYGYSNNMAQNPAYPPPLNPPPHNPAYPSAAPNHSYYQTNDFTHHAAGFQNVVIII
jgi:hypothetical protein